MSTADFSEPTEADEPAHPLNPREIARLLSHYGEPDDSEKAKAFAAEHGLTVRPLIRMGARCRGSVLAFPYAVGVKFLRMDSGEHWSAGQLLRAPLAIHYGADPGARVLLAADELDGAALLELYPWDVAVPPCAGWSAVWSAQLGAYPCAVIAHREEVPLLLPAAPRHVPAEGGSWSDHVTGHGLAAAPEIAWPATPARGLPQYLLKLRPKGML